MKKKIDLLTTDIPAVIEEVKKGPQSELRDAAIKVLEMAQRLKEEVINAQEDNGGSEETDTSVLGEGPDS